jgi:CheY-like chemotaxis protein
LIIDDEPFNLKAMEVLLSLAAKEMRLNQTQFKGLIDFCSSGREALGLVKDFYNKSKTIYGLIITDCSMPVMDGYETSQAIRKFYTQY